MTDTAVVIGSTSNIGRAIAEGRSADGSHAVVTPRHGEEARAVAESLPGDATGIAVDVTEPAEIDALFAAVDETEGDFSVLVNSVARNPNESILECDLETGRGRCTPPSGATSCARRRPPGGWPTPEVGAS